MPKYRFKFFLFILAGATVYAACRKTDQPVNQQPAENQATRFFSDHASGDPFVQNITQFVKRENEKYNFVEKLIKQIGYPQWDKAIVTSGKRHIGNRGASDSAATIFIPFVAENQNTVNASLVITTSPSDTSFRFLCDWQYKNREHGSASTDTTAENMATLFMLLDNAVFGYSRFTLTDSSLFANMPVLPGATGREIVLNNTPPQLSGNNDLQTIIICFYVYVCRTPAWCANHGGCDYLHCPTGACTYNYTCFDFEVEEGSGGGEEGGTGGGSGGWTPPNNPNPCSGTSARTELEEGCGTGWVPTGGGTGSVPPPADPFDSLLRKAARLVNRYRDSLSALCEADTSERFFNIVKYNNQYDTFRVMKSKSSEEVNPNYYMTGGRILLAEWHYHPKYPDGTSGSWPSGGDVSKLDKKPTGHLMLIDTYDDRYALVVEDSAKFANWEKIMGNGPVKFPERVINSVEADPRYWSGGSVYLQMTKEKISQMLGSSNACGIGLYQATSSHGTTFIKIN